MPPILNLYIVVIFFACLGGPSGLPRSAGRLLAIPCAYLGGFDFGLGLRDSGSFHEFYIQALCLIQCSRTLKVATTGHGYAKF